MNGRFSRKTFEYFEEAGRNRKNLKWFMKNQSLYESEVKLPFSTLLNKLEVDLKAELQGISFHPRKISLPVYRTENIPEDGTVVKPFAWAFLSEKKTSLFEWNPGINIYIGDEISLGLGLFHPSSRQMKLLRETLAKNPATFSREVKAKRFNAVWGDLAGEKFSRFPKDFDPEGTGAEYLWYKQFIVTKNLTRKDLLSPGVSDRISSDIRAGAGFLSWIRKTVGTYEKEIG